MDCYATNKAHENKRKGINILRYALKNEEPAKFREWIGDYFL